MTELQLNQLIKIFNTLKLVMTSGEDTLIMAQCLTALKELIEGVQPQEN